MTLLEQISELKQRLIIDNGEGRITSEDVQLAQDIYRQIDKLWKKRP